MTGRTIALTSLFSIGGTLLFICTCCVDFMVRIYFFTKIFVSGMVTLVVHFLYPDASLHNLAEATRNIPRFGYARATHGLQRFDSHDVHSSSRNIYLYLIHFRSILSPSYASRQAALLSNPLLIMHGRLIRRNIRSS